MTTKISWADETWNPITGCTPVSEACENCYARRMANRLRGRFGYPKDNPFKVTFHPDRLERPLRWKKPKKIFVCSMGDLFHEEVPHYTYYRPKDLTINHIYFMAQRCNQHIFMFLTKRPLAMRTFFSWKEKMAQNLWLGVTAENQRTADERIPILLQIPAAVRFISIEPMLSEIDIYPWLDPLYKDKDGPFEKQPDKAKLHWVIVGGETGPGARPMRLGWVRSIRDQCQAAGVPFFFKGWGEWCDIENYYEAGLDLGRFKVHWFEDGKSVLRFGKKKAGRVLDGRTWEEFPNG